MWDRAPSIHQLRRVPSGVGRWPPMSKDPVTCWGSIDWNLELWGKTLYPGRDAHLVLPTAPKEQGFFLRLQASPKKKKKFWSVWSMGRNSAAVPTPCATSRLPTCPTLRGCAPLSCRAPRAEAGAPPPLHAVPQAPRVGPLPEPGQHGPLLGKPCRTSTAPASDRQDPSRVDGATPHRTTTHCRPRGPRRWTLEGWAVAIGESEGPRGRPVTGPRRGHRPASSLSRARDQRPVTRPRTWLPRTDLKKTACLEQPLADQHHRTISVVPFLPSCRPSRRRALPTVIPPRSPAFDVTVTPTPARRCPSTT